MPYWLYSEVPRKFGLFCGCLEQEFHDFRMYIEGLLGYSPPQYVRELSDKSRPQTSLGLGHEARHMNGLAKR